MIIQEIWEHYWQFHLCIRGNSCLFSVFKRFWCLYNHPVCMVKYLTYIYYTVLDSRAPECLSKSLDRSCLSISTRSNLHGFITLILFLNHDRKFLAEGMTYEARVSLPKRDSKSFMVARFLVKDLICLDQRMYLYLRGLGRIILLLINQLSTIITLAGFPSTS